MSQHEDESHFTQPARMVKFGSLITLNLEENFSYFMFAEGFQDQRVKIKKFEVNDGQNEVEEDFTQCKFMILPFNSEQAFSHCKDIIDKIKKDSQFVKGEKLADRKKEVFTQKNKIDGELNINLVNLIRQTGQKILLINSNFMLLHVNTMKFLTINLQNPENIQVELMDEPNKFSFFKFFPCLALQLQRNDNFIYEEELFYICGAETLDGKHPYIISENSALVNSVGGQQQGVAQQSKLGGGAAGIGQQKGQKQQKSDIFVLGSIDQKKAWKLNLYLEPNLSDPSSESHDYIKVGDVVWMILSEVKFYLSASRNSDPFLDEQYQGLLQKKRRPVQQPPPQQQQQDAQMRSSQTLGKPSLKSSTHEQLQQKQADQPIQEELGDDTHQMENSVVIPDLGEGENGARGNFQASDLNVIDPEEIQQKQAKIFSDFSSQFSSILNTRENDMITTFDLQPEGLWKIEGIDFQKGGEIEWYQPYRFRHIISGKFLTLVRSSGGGSYQEDDQRTNAGGGAITAHHITHGQYRFELHDEKDKRQLFQFIKIDNLMSKYESKTKIHKDAYFRLQHYETKSWLGFDEQNLKNYAEDSGVVYEGWDQPKLFTVFKDINTFRFRVAEFLDVWEINFLTSCKRIFFETVSQVQIIDKQESEIKIMGKKLQNFDHLQAKSLLSLKSLEDFILNRLIFNVDLNNEYGFPTYKRQEQFRQQLVFGLLLWVLIKVFPAREEWNKTKIKPSMDIIRLEYLKIKGPDGGKDAQSKGKSGGSQSLAQGQDQGGSKNQENKTAKQIENHLKKRYIMSYQIYQLVKQLCYNNPQNQLYLFGFVPQITAHIGLGEFVSDTIQFCFSKNEYILNTLNRIEFKQEEEDLGGNNNMFGKQENKKDNFFKTIIKRLKRFEVYTKNDVLDMIGQFCKFQNQSIFTNQEKIYNSFVDNRTIIFTSLLKITSERVSCPPGQNPNKIMVHVRKQTNQEFKFEKQELLVFQSKNPQFIPFLISQIKLYSQMSANRNFTCVKAFSEIFPLDYLIGYISDGEMEDGQERKGSAPRLNGEVRAALCDILLNLYIDKEPRMLIQKPNLVRITPPKVEKRKKLNFPLMINTNNPPEKKFNKEEEISVEFIKMNAKEQQKQMNQIKEIVRKIIGDQSQKIEEIKKSKPEKTASSKEIYTPLLLQIVQTFHILLKFGMYTSFVDEIGVIDQDEEIPESQKSSAQKNSKAQMEEIIKYLAELLEYQETYFMEIYSHTPQLKRSYVHNQEQDQKEDLLGNAIPEFELDDILKMIGISLKDELEECYQEDSTIISRQQAQEDKNMSKSFLKIYSSLKKLVNKYENKTFQAPEFNLDFKQNVEENIKIEICKIFDYLLNWREDFYLDNLIEYHTREVLPGTVDEVIPKILPRDMLSINQKLSKHLKDSLFEKQKEVNDEQVRNIDEILARPFVEVLLVTFHFAVGPELQNSVMNLIYRCYTQKQKLVKNISKLSMTSNEDNIYKKMSTLVKQLKTLHSYTQSWLQIIESNTYNEQAEENLITMANKFRDLANLMKTDAENKHFEKLKIKQKIFKHLHTHIFIVQFLEQSTSVLESNFHYFKSDDKQSSYSYKQNFITYIYQVFQEAHKCLQYFIIYNPQTQKTIFKYYKRLLKNQNHLNIGQIEFIQEIFKNNTNLISKKVEEIMPYLQYNLQLIKYHGQLHQFLDIFLTFLDHLPKDSLSTQRAILDIMLDENQKSIYNPFIDKINNEFRSVDQLEQDRNRQVSLFDDQQQATSKRSPIPFFGKHKDQEKEKDLYVKKFIRIICTCLDSDLGVNLIVKSYRNLDVKYLLPFLKDMRLKQIRDSPKISQESKKTELEYIKYFIKLLIIYFQKLQDSINGFKINQNDFIRMLDEEREIFTKQYEKGLKFEKEDCDYYTLYLVPLINIFVENFVKDLVLLSILQLEKAEDYENGKKVLFFTESFSQKISLLFDFNTFENIDRSYREKIKNILKLFSVFRIKVPKNYIIVKKIVDKEFFYDDINLLRDNDQILQDNESGASVFDEKKQKEIREIIIQNDQKVLLKESQQDQQEEEQQQQADGQKQKEPSKKNEQVEEFKFFINSIRSSKVTKRLIKEEGRLLMKSLISFDQIIQNPTEAKDKDILLTKDDIIKKILSYVENWRERGANKSTVIFFIKSLRHIITQNPNSMIDPEIEEDPEELMNRQFYMDSLGSTQVFLRLFWNEDSSDQQYLYYLIRFLSSILEGGNRQIQEKIYFYISSNVESEKLFYLFTQIIQGEISLIKKSQGRQTSIGKVIDGVAQKPLIEYILRFLQLLCEGHYTDMQDYLRHQKASKVNYDIVSLMVNMLLSFKITNDTQDAIRQCLDTLTEVVQGPSKENQHKIVQSKFLEFAVEILREDESIYEYGYKSVEPVDKATDKQSSEEDQKGDKYKEVVHNNSIHIEMQQQLSPSEKGSEAVLNEKNLLNEPSEKDTKLEKVKVNLVERKHIVRLKYKTLITILSLLELSESDVQINNRIRRTIPLKLLCQTLTDIYDQFKKKYKGEYQDTCFGNFDYQSEEKKDDKNAEEFIIEIGFFIYILIVILLTNIQDKTTMDNEQLEIYEIIQKNSMVTDKSNQGILEGTVFGDLISLVKSFLNEFYEKSKQIAEVAKRQTMTDEEKKEFDKKKEQEEINKRKELQNEALQFFAKNTVHIDIVRFKQLSTVYFPLLPCCKLLPKETKEEFHDSVDINNPKGKLSAIMEWNEDIIKIVKHEEKLGKIFKKYFLLSILAKNKALWENLAFYTTCAINFIIMISYFQDEDLIERIQQGESSSYTGDINDFAEVSRWVRLEQPKYFYDPSNASALQAIKILGIINLVLSAVTVGLFFVKKAPLLLYDMWRQWWNMRLNKLYKFLYMIYNIVLSVYKCVSDFDFVYYMMFMILLTVGLTIHPFFFGLLMLDFVRTKLLKNVIRAVWYPRDILALSFAFFLVLVYFFTVVVYIAFNEQMPDRYCSELWLCYIKVFDNIFKQDGGIGGVLSDPYAPEDPGPYIDEDGEWVVMYYPYIGRFILDNLAMWVLNVIGINIFAGIIIDTFGSLKDEQQEKEEDLEQNCFICSIDREKLDKAYEVQNGFIQHIKADHYLWNYVFFMAWVRAKDDTEYTGNETYVLEQYETTDVSWFPIKKARGVMDDDEETLQIKQEKLLLISKKVNSLKEQVQSLLVRLKNKLTI